MEQPLSSPPARAQPLSRCPSPAAGEREQPACKRRGEEYLLSQSTFGAAQQAQSRNSSLGGQAGSQARSRPLRGETEAREGQSQSAPRGTLKEPRYPSLPPPTSCCLAGASLSRLAFLGGPGLCQHPAPGIQQLGKAGRLKRDIQGAGMIPIPNSLRRKAHPLSANASLGTHSQIPSPALGIGIQAPSPSPAPGDEISTAEPLINIPGSKQIPGAGNVHPGAGWEWEG